VIDGFLQAGTGAYRSRLGAIALGVYFAITQFCAFPKRGIHAPVPKAAVRMSDAGHCKRVADKPVNHCYVENGKKIHATGALSTGRKHYGCQKTGGIPDLVSGR
jgi:hypothetical protein